MKKMMFYFFACIMLAIFFVSCSRSLFPEKEAYNVVIDSINVSSSPSSPTLMRAVAYKNDLFIYKGDNLFTWGRCPKPTPRPLPGPPSPCRPGHCHMTLSASATAGNLMLKIEEDKIELEMKIKSGYSEIVNIIKTAPENKIYLVPKK